MRDFQILKVKNIGLKHYGLIKNRILNFNFLESDTRCTVNIKKLSPKNYMQIYTAT
jgi:hypothetical protein